MCIIAAKASGVAMPSDEYIKNMWVNNPDGAGYMYAEGGNVYIRKGFMTFDAFKQSLGSLTATHDMTELPLVMHFRITTHGGTKPENTHPFPISDSIGMLSKLDCCCPIGAAHNGIITIDNRPGISDTMEYIASQLAPLRKAVPDFYKNQHLMQMIRNAIRSRMVLLTGDGSLYYVGDFVSDNGMLYSNSSYKHSNSWRDFSFGGRGSWGAFEWDDGCMSDYDGEYSTMEVMWLTGDGSYVIEDENTFIEAQYGDFAIDAGGVVYEYDMEVDALRKLPGAQAMNAQGLPVVFRPNDKWAGEELVYAPYTRFEDINGQKKKKYSKKAGKK